MQVNINVTIPIDPDQVAQNTRYMDLTKHIANFLQNDPYIQDRLEDLSIHPAMSDYETAAATAITMLKWLELRRLPGLP